MVVVTEEPISTGLALHAQISKEILDSAVLAEESDPEQPAPDEGQQRDILVEQFTGLTSP